MAGNMFGLSCPKCGCSGRIGICVEVWARLTRDGTDDGESADGSHTWDDNSTALCGDCRWCGLVKQLNKDDEEEDEA